MIHLHSNCASFIYFMFIFFIVICTQSFPKSSGVSENSCTLFELEKWAHML
ncbi:hypothetical protein Hanom_Chr02g00124031 [Helianthus anomalus]